ncbi:MAG: ankyrin repeat domain-containing protein [Epsilonproteobacteria bacterium]|nr:ankyrin repeat domain-containing protein [Campylobacterota bacterium]
MHKWLELLKRNDYISIKKYIRDGGNVNERSETGESVLMYALRYRCDEDIIELLIQSGADLKAIDNEGVSIFDMAITYDNLDLVRSLVEEGIYDVNATSRKSGFTPLMCATCYGRIEVVKYLLEQGADKEAFEMKGLRARDFARKMNKKSVLKLLEE